MTEIKSVTYKTIDGKLFDNKDAAIKHEDNLLKVKTYKVYAYPDLTEGRHGAKFQGYLLVHTNGHQEWFAEEWCYNKYKNRINFVMGAYGDNAIMENWSISECKLSEIDLENDKVLDKIEENFIEKIWK